VTVKKLALKRLTKPDLTIFEWHFRNRNAGNQKSINLNAGVFINELYPAVAAVALTNGNEMPVSVGILGPGVKTELPLARKIIKGAAYKMAAQIHYVGHVLHHDRQGFQRFNVNIKQFNPIEQLWWPGLTPDGARMLAQAQLEGDATRGNIAVDIGALMNRLGIMIYDPQQLARTMQRLLKLGYLNQQTVNVTYPDISGQWRGPTPIPDALPGQQMILQLSMNRDAKPPTISGAYGQCSPAGRCFLGSALQVSGLASIHWPWKVPLPASGVG
jgi:hypothetical protein